MSNPLSPPPPKSIRPGGGLLVPEKNASMSYAEDRNCETLLSEIVCTSFVLTVVRFLRSAKEPVRAVVQGPSPHGEQYRSIVHKRGATEVAHDRTETAHMEISLPEKKLGFF